MARHYRIIDARDQKKYVKGVMGTWRGHPGIRDQQTARPAPFRLPFVKPKETLFVYAGNTGEVGAAVRGVKKIFSDGDKHRAGSVRDRYGKKFHGVLIADATSLPLKKQSVDWFFSHEPVPLDMFPSHIPRMLLQARRGIILTSTLNREYLPHRYDEVARLYGLKERRRVIKIREAASVGLPPALDAMLPPKRIPKLYVTAYELNPRARTLAERDMRLLDEIDLLGRQLSQADMEAIRKRLGIGPKQLRESLKRLDRLAFHDPSNTITVDY